MAKQRFPSLRFPSLFLASILACFQSATGQEADSSYLAIMQDFQVGTTYYYQLERGKSDSRRPHLDNITTLTDITFHILERQGDLKVCSWKYGETTLLGFPAEQIPESSKKLLNMHQGFEVEFLIDSAGTMFQVTNLEACKSFLQKAVTLLPQIANRTVSEEESQKISQALAPSFASQETLLNTYCPEITLFFNLFGQVIHPDTTYLFVNETPNPLGGRSYPIETSTQISEMNDSIAVITVDQAIPEDELTSILAETVEGLSKMSDNPIRAEEVPAFNSRTHSRFFFDHRTHTLIEAVSEQTIQSEDDQQISTLKIRLKETRNEPK